MITATSISCDCETCRSAARIEKLVPLVALDGYTSKSGNYREFLAQSRVIRGVADRKTRCICKNIRNLASIAEYRPGLRDLCVDRIVQLQKRLGGE